MEEGHLRRKSIPHPSYPFENAKHWRLRAEAMRTLAEEAIDSTVRAMMGYVNETTCTVFCGRDFNNTKATNSIVTHISHT
jgi:hypothetical protein